MASNVPSFRFVRCPKCRNLVTEFASIPVYECGGCGNILRAKYYNATVKNVASGMHESTSKNMQSELDTSGQEMIVSPLEVITSCNEKGESSNSATHDSEEGGTNLNTPQPIDNSGLGFETNSKGDIDMPLENSNATIKASNKMEESAMPVNQCVGNEDMQADSLRSTTTSSHAYYGSASSPDDGFSDRDPNKYLILSKVTARHKEVVDTIDHKGKSFTNIVGNVDLASQHQSRSSPAKSSNEGQTSTPTSSSDSDRAESSSRYGFDALEQDGSFDSEDFHSVQNWMSPRKIAQSKSISREPVVRGESFDCQKDTHANHMKILRKVDELRGELSELFDQALEGKWKSHLRSIKEEEFTPSPKSNTHTFNSVDPQPRKYLSPRIYNDKPQAHEHALKKPERKETMQSIKRHCRPVAGGAPFVICYKCFNLLQLPADFLVSRRKFHKLQCGSCSEVLLYSFRPRVSKVLQIPVAVQHPPDDVENSTNTNIRNEMPASHSNEYTCKEQISSSEEYVLSFPRSDSVNPETVLHVSRSSSYQIDEQNDTEIKPPQLHKLLGYASASEILYRFSESDEGYNSTEPDTPRFYIPSKDFDSIEVIGGREIRTHSESLDIEPLSNFTEMGEDDRSPRRSRNRRGLPPVPGWLKKGMRGLDNVKLKIQSHGRTIQS